MSRNLRELGIKRREQIYQFIIKYINDKGYAPSIREIADAVGITGRLKRLLMYSEK